jgi:deoxyribonuclease V
MDGLKAAVDVHYDEAEGRALAAAVIFASWADEAPARTRVRWHQGLEPYVSGELYRRELPCLLPLLEEVRRETRLDVVLVDGHVDLGEARPGLGRHLFEALRGEVEVVGVAKRPFEGALSLPVRRGRSERPLWVSSTRSAEDASRQVAAMHGAGRIPTLLRLVDRLARGLEYPG